MRRREFLGGPAVLGAGLQVRERNTSSGARAGWIETSLRLYFNRARIEKLSASPRWPAILERVLPHLQAGGRRMHVNSDNVIEGWETDACLLALTRPAGSPAGTPGTAARYFVSSGSYLRKDGAAVLDSLTKVDRVWAAQARNR